VLDLVIASLELLGRYSNQELLCGLGAMEVGDFLDSADGLK